MIDNQSMVTSPLGVQKIGKDKSPALPKVKDPSFNLRDRLNDSLFSEKYMMDAYTTGSKELLCQTLYQLATDNLHRSKEIQRQLFEELFNLGEYQADTAAPNQIQDAQQMFMNYKVQLPYPQIQ